MTADLDGLVRLERSQLKPAAEVLARAFYDDPLFTYYFPDASQRKNMSPRLFEFWLRYAVAYGEIYATSPDLEGIAVWLPSEKANQTLWGKIISGSFFLYVKLGREIMAKRRPVIEFVSLIHRLRAPFRHWYLEFIGVKPELQGKGYAGTLLRAMFARLDKERLPCYLETQNPDNVPIYQHYGFRVVEEVDIPGTGLRHFAMLREKASK